MSMFPRFAGALLMLGWVPMLGISDAFSKDLPFQVLPWNGSKAALSLTYDDGDPIHLDVAIPEMNKRRMRGTFFLITGRITRETEWQEASRAGHEIGNHTVNHRHANELTPADEESEVVEARRALEKLAGKPVLGFAYPFVEITDGLKKWIAPNALAARGGGGGALYMTPDSRPDWMNIPSQTTLTNYTFDNYQFWVDENLSRGAWTVLMIHAIEGSSMWQPIPKDTYLKFLDYLAKKRKDLWIAPFGEVAAYWKAQKILEDAVQTRNGGELTIRWVKPDPFPEGVMLKARFPKTVTAEQGGKKLPGAGDGTCLVSFDSGELTLRGSIPETVHEIPPPPEE